MMSRCRFFSALLVAAVLAVGSVGMTASAEEAENKQAEEITTENISADEPDETEETTETEENTEDITELEISFSEETTENSDSDTVLSEREYELIRELADGLVTEDEKIDYYSDEYYDTNGNASLVKSEKIIYDTEEMQFIAVTTKDGAVFYILINYSAENAEEQVYFLNKVDTFDLYSLLYMTDDEEENGIDIERAKQAEEAALNLENADMSVTEESENEEDMPEEVQTTQSTSMDMTMIYILFGALILGGVGFAGFKLLKKPKQKPVIEETEIEEDEDYCFYDEGEEVNEDNE